jgi:hypothetical protein
VQLTQEFSHRFRFSDWPNPLVPAVAASDYLLRQHKMVDLYQVVREAIRVSEPAYSIKNIEHFYLEARAGNVTNAGATSQSSRCDAHCSKTLQEASNGSTLRNRHASEVECGIWVYGFASRFLWGSFFD